MIGITTAKSAKRSTFKQLDSANAWTTREFKILWGNIPPQNLKFPGSPVEGISPGWQPLA